MVFEKTRKLIAAQFDIEEEKITAETAFVEDLSADSLDIVELIMAIEQEFEISIDDEKIENVKTVGDVVTQIEALM